MKIHVKIFKPLYLYFKVFCPFYLNLKLYFYLILIIICSKTNKIRQVPNIFINIAKHYRNSNNLLHPSSPSLFCITVPLTSHFPLVISHTALRSPSAAVLTQSVYVTIVPFSSWPHIRKTVQSSLSYHTICQNFYF